MQKKKKEIPAPEPPKQNDPLSVSDENAAASEETPAASQTQPELASADAAALKQREQDVADREKALEREKAELEALRITLQEREKALTERDQRVTAREANADAKEQQLNQREAEIEKQSLDLKGRELNAQNGFLREQAKAAEALREELKKLQAKIAAAETENQESRTAANEEADRIRSDARQDARAVREQADSDAARVRHDADEEAEKSRKRARDEAAQIRQAALDEAEQSREDIRTQQQNIDSAQRALQSKQEQLKIDRCRLEAETDALRLSRDDLSNTVEKRVAEAYSDLQNQLKAEVQKSEHLAQECNVLRERLRNLERIQRCADGRDTDELLQSEADLKQKLREQERSIRELQNLEADMDSIKQKAADYDTLSANHRELRRQYEQLQQASATRSEYEDELRRMQFEKKSAALQRDMALEQVKAINIQYGMLEQQVNAMKEMAQRPTEREARIRDITNVRFVSQKIPLLAEEITEIEWLNRIYEKMCASGIQISERLFVAFHTALKTAEWSPITVLSGVSGTGKSLLPKLYARYGGVYFLPLAVQPDWDSSQSLFGFFNALDNRFNATKLLSALMQFQTTEFGDNPDALSLSDSMMLVLLDEMNLAHVELYFSELLSKLEDRRGEAKDVYIDVDLGSGLEKYAVALSRNILWVGTMNEDETTKSLSDKVIDRSSMLNFPSPKTFARRTSEEYEPAQTEMLPCTLWKKWVNNAVEFEADDPILLQYKEAVEGINRALGSVGRALGHRVWQAMEHYITKHPRCVSAALERSEKPEDFAKAVQFAFEEAVVYKICPKLRGIELTYETKRDCFDRIGEILQKNALGLKADYDLACKGDQFIWRSAEYLNDPEWVISSPLQRQQE